MKMKVAAIFAFLLNTVLFATYYSVSKEALGRIDPIVFTFFEMASLVPVALCILALSWRQLTRAVVRRGVILGSSLCLALFTISIALKYTTATSTAFFPSLNGFLAAFFAWLFLRQPIKKTTWFAGALSVGGAVLLIMNAEMGGIRGSLIAFLGGLFFTVYVFLSDHEQKEEKAHWPLFAIELLTMAAWASLMVLLFGDWQALHPDLPKDIWLVLYVAGACTFLPTLIAVLMQKHISPITVSFIYILEPVLGAIMAALYLHEELSLPAYAGGGLVVVGAVIHTLGARSGMTAGQRLVQEGRRLQHSYLVALLSPVLFVGAGSFLLCGLGGFPPAAWRSVYHLGPRLFTLVQLGQAAAVSSLLAQALGWLVAWIVLLGVGVFVTGYSLRKVMVVRSLAFSGEKVKQQAVYEDWMYAVQEEGYREEQEIASAYLVAAAMPAVHTEPLSWETRALRQLGVATHPTSARRNRDKPLIQRRRRERRLRLAGIDDGDTGGALLMQDLDLESLPNMDWSAKNTPVMRSQWATPEVIEVWQEG